LAFLGILRAGLIVSPLALWRRAECAAALAMIDARALVTASRIGTADHCEIAMYRRCLHGPSRRAVRRLP
jgi:hypothetical protein